MASCEIKHPTVTTKDGKEIEAPLYTELKGLVDILTAREIYNDAVSEDFKKQPFYIELVADKQIDEYGQPTIDGLIAHTDFSRYIDNTIYSESVKNSLFGEEITIKSTSDFIQVLSSIKEWNDNHEYNNAILVRTPDGKFDLQVYKRTKSAARLVANANRFLDVMVKTTVEGSTKDLFQFFIDNYNVYNVGSQLNPDIVIDKLNAFVSNKAEYDDFLSLIKSMPVYSNTIGLRLSKMISAESSFMVDYIYRNGLLQSKDYDKTKEVVESNPKLYAGIIKNHLLYMAYTHSAVGDSLLYGLENAEHYNNLIKRLNDSLTNDLKTIHIPDKEDIDTTVNADVELPQFNANENYFQKKFREHSTDEGDIIKKILSLERDILNRAGRIYSKDDLKKMRKKTKNLEKVIENGSTYKGLVDYLSETIEYLKELQSKINKEAPLNKQAKSVKSLMDKCAEYSNIVEYFNAYVESNGYKEDLKEYLNSILNEFNVNKTMDELTLDDLNNLYPLHEELREYKQIFDRFFNNDFVFNELNELTTMISRFQTNLKTYAVELTAQFLEQYQTDEGSVYRFGKHKGEDVDIRQLLKRAENDINVYNKLFSAMADCPDTIFRLTDKAMKTQKGMARLETQDLMREIKKEARILEDSGVKDFSWLYSRHSDGTKNGRYVSRDDDEYLDIVSDPAKKRFYDFFMGTKNILDMMYPESAIDNEYRIIGIRKNKLERLKSANGIKGLGKELWEGIKDDYMERSDDEDIAGYSELFTDSTGNEFKLLPIYYNNFDYSEADNMSEDAVSTLVAYASKAIEYKHLNEIIDLIEIEKVALKEREMPSTDGKLKVLNLFDRAFYKNNKEEMPNSIVHHKDNGTSNAYKMFDSWVDMQFYGRWRQREGTIGDTGISTAKVVDMFNKRTAMASMSLNLLNGISNIMTGTAQTRIETILGSLGRGYVSMAEMAKADMIYAKEIIPYVGELGNRIKKSKMALFSEMLNVSQDFESDVTELAWHEDTWAKRAINSSALSFIQDSGEHYMSHRMAIAIALHTKLKNNRDEEVSLWDALKVVYMQEDGSYGLEDKGLGAKLALDGEYTLNGNKFVFDGEDLYKLERKITGINQKIHGIYNKQDANIIQRYSAGRLIYMFRKWIPAAIDRRFMEAQYNYDTDEWKEGYYRTTYNFIKQLITEREGLKLNLVLKFKQLDPEQQANVIRALTEAGTFLMALLGSKYIPDDDDDDDDSNSKQSWAYNMLNYQMVRLSSELAAMTPISVFNVDQNMLSETLKLFKSPIAAANTMQDSYSILGLLNPYAYFDDVKSGQFKDHSKAYKIIMSNKFWNPLGTLLYKNSHPEAFVGWYK